MKDPTRLATTLTLLTALAISTPAPAQEQTHDRLSLRVNSAHDGGKVVVDRGKRHFVEVGDRVVLRPRGGKTYEGKVIEVLDRQALVQMNSRTLRPTAGTRGHIFIPKKRGEPEKPDPKTNPKPDPKKDPKASTKQPVNPNKPNFRNRDENWKPGMPLLTQGKPVRPADRPTRLTGRIYSIGRYANTARSSDNDSFFRLGTVLDVDNPFGQGGGFHFDGEFNHRTELTGNTGADLLLRGLSYVMGGTRFDEDRVEFGRFLQRGVPELQVLDGVEWSARRANGDKYGASVGFLPEPDEDYESMEDFQLAAWYLWHVGEREDLVFGGAFQKTWHNGVNDRDLFIAKLRYSPRDEWNVHSTMWIDFYDSGEVAQSSGVDITQAFVSLNRHWHNGDGVDLTWRRVRFADILRNEYLPILAGDIADNRYDRLALTSWLSMTKDSRFRSELAVWDDEEDSGGSVELGIETDDVFTDRDRLDLTLIGSLNQPSTGAGGRVHYGVRGDNGAWDVLYEYGFHHFRGFPSNKDNIAQHLLQASRSFFNTSGWDLTFQAGAVGYDNEYSFMVDFYLQKSF